MKWKKNPLLSLFIDFFLFHTPKKKNVVNLFPFRCLFLLLIHLLFFSFSLTQIFMATQWMNVMDLFLVRGRSLLLLLLMRSHRKIAPWLPWNTIQTRSVQFMILSIFSVVQIKFMDEGLMMKRLKKGCLKVYRWG